VDRLAVLERIQKRVLWLGTYMVHHANSLRASADGIKVGAIRPRRRRSSAS